MATLADERKALKRLAAATTRVVGIDHEYWGNCESKENYKAYIASSDSSGRDGIMISAFTLSDAVDLALAQLKEQEAKSESSPS